MTKPLVSLLLLRLVDEDSGSPSATVRGRKYGKTFMSVVPCGTTHAYASLVVEGDRDSGGGGPRVTRGDKFGE